MERDARYERARKRVQILKGFYVHLTVYLAVNAGLLLINLLTSPRKLWFFWPLLGWGIGVAAHAVSVFGVLPMFTKDWEERKIRELMEREGGGR